MPAIRFALFLAIAPGLATGLFGQDLAPRAYVITPADANAVILAWSYFNGGLELNGAVPLTGATGTSSVQIFSYYHSFSLLGRSANVTGSLPYAVGTFAGSVGGRQGEIYRSGLGDAGLRLSVNLKGGPAMNAKDFMEWKQRVLLGVSLRVIAPTGQYDGRRLVNWGINRWAFKPEFGYSQRWGNWVLDGYAGVWFFTTNNASFTGGAPAPGTQNPIGSFEGHLSRDFTRRRLWVSLDGNFWIGGTTTLNGVLNPSTEQTSSRIGGTVSVPVSKHDTLKMSYSVGTYIRFGGNYQDISAGWQHHWLGKP